MLEKLKQSFVFGLIIIKVNTDLFEKENRTHHRTVFIHTIFKIAIGKYDWEVTLFEKCESHKQLKEKETFWQRKLKTFYPLGLNEKEEYFFYIIVIIIIIIIIIIITIIIIFIIIIIIIIMIIITIIINLFHFGFEYIKYMLYKTTKQRQKNNTQINE